MHGLLPAGEKAFHFPEKKTIRRVEGKVERGVFLVCESRTGPTCELQGLLLVDGVDGIEESGNSETSMLPDKNSNSWIFKRIKKGVRKMHLLGLSFTQ